MKIKEKLIHLLGGYTKDEFNVINAQEHICSTVGERQIRTLKASYRINTYFEVPPEETIQDDLTIRLAKTMKEEGLIKFTSIEETNERPPEMQAIIHVIKPL